MNSLNFMMLMLMIQLPFTEDSNLEVPKYKVKSVIAPVCEWKPAETKAEIIFFEMPSIDSPFKPGDYVRRAMQDNYLNSGFGTSIVISRYGGKVIVNFPVDGDGNVIVGFVAKKDGC